MADIGLPKISILFKGLGTSAVQRGSRGVAVLIVKDDTSTEAFFEYRGIDEFTTEEQAKFTADNAQYIKDCLEGTPQKLIIARMDTISSLTDLLSQVKAKVTMNCWIGIAEGTVTDHDELVSFVQSSNTNDNKRYKALVYNATASDDMHVVNFTNTDITFTDSRGKQTGNKAISYLLGYLAGLPLTMSAIAKVLSKLESVVEPADLETAVNNGEFVLYNDESEVRVARSVNSLFTVSGDITGDMKMIHVIEILDLMYTDIYTTWNDNYKGRYPNSLDNQMLLISALNGYLQSLANDGLLDLNFNNKCNVDIDVQRLANLPKYGEEVYNWTIEEVLNHTVATNVHLKGQVKVLGIMEDITFGIAI